MKQQTIIRPPDWFNRTPGKIANAMAEELDPEQGYVIVITRNRKGKSLSSTFYFHDGVAKKRRESKEHTRNGMCPHCGFFSVNQDLYLIIGDHPEAGRVTSPHDAKRRAIIARFGYGYACSQCVRDNGWTIIDNPRKQIWDADWKGYIDEDYTRWYQVEPLPATYSVERGLPLCVVSHTYWSKITIVRKEEEELHGRPRI